MASHISANVIVLIFLGSGQYPDICGGLWTGVFSGHQPSDSGRYPSMWGIPYIDFVARIGWGRETPPGYALLCILLKSKH